MRAMRVIQMIDLLHWGGAQKLLVTFAGAAQAQGITTTVISLREDSDTPVIARELQQLGAEVLVFEGQGLFDPRRIWRLSRYLRQHADVLHTHLTYANIIGALAARLAGVPVVASIHNVRDDEPYYHPLKERIESGVLRFLVQRVVAVGHIVADVNRARLKGRAQRIIPNAVDFPAPIDEATRAALRREMVGDPTRPLILSVGRLSPQKAYADLLSAFAELRTVHPRAALAIAGDGPLRAELEQQLAALELQGHAHLLGVRNDVPALLEASDLFVSSSHWEGLPIAVLEAMAAGLPVVATSVGDVPRVIVDGTGTLVPAQAPAALASAIAAFLDDPAAMEAAGRAARAHVEAHHSPQSWTAQLLALYRELVPA